MKNAHTLVEVIVALVVLEIALVGIVGVFHLASTTLARAEVLESAVSVAEGVVDSLKRADVILPGRRDLGDAVVTWRVAEDGSVFLQATTADSIMLFGFPVRLVGP